MVAVAKPVRLYAVNDIIFLLFRKGEGLEHVAGDFCSLFSVAYGSFELILMRPAYIVQIGGNGQDLQVGTFTPADMHAQLVYPQRMFPVMRIFGAREMVFGKGLDCFNGVFHALKADSIFK